MFSFIKFDNLPSNFKFRQKKKKKHQSVFFPKRILTPGVKRAQAWQLWHTHLYSASYRCW